MFNAFKFTIYHLHLEFKQFRKLDLPDSTVSIDNFLVSLLQRLSQLRV